MSRSNDPIALFENEAELIHEALNTKGWDILEQRFADQFEGVNQVAGCADEKEMWLRQGQLVILQQLLLLKEEIQEEMNSADL